MSLDSEETVGVKPDGSGAGVSEQGGKGQLRLETAFGDATFTGEGDAEVVLRAFEAFKEHDAAHHRPRTPAKQRPDNPAETSETEDEREQKTEALPLPAFLKQFQLKTNFETAVAIAVWASRQPKGTKEFDKDSLEKLWGASGEKVPGNVGAELNRATLKGWMTRASRGKFELVAYGEDYVDKTLARAKSGK